MIKNIKKGTKATKATKTGQVKSTLNQAIAIMKLYPTANIENFEVRDEGDSRGQYIAHWDIRDKNGVLLKRPTIPELKSAFTAHTIEQERVEYQVKRRAEYPSIEDQLDAIWKILTKADDVDSAKVQKEIEDVKVKYPKGKW